MCLVATRADQVDGAVARVLHRADPHAVGAAAMPTGPCTGAQGRRLPTGPPPRPLAGARVPLGARSTGGVGRSRQVGPIRTAYDSSIRITIRDTGGGSVYGALGRAEIAPVQFP